MATSRPSTRMSVPEFRKLLRKRHGEESDIDDASAQRAELLFNLSRAVNRLSLDFESLHRRNGLSWSGFRILNVIWVLDDAEVSEIARLSGTSRATAWSALNTLERSGFVARTRDTNDRRMVRARLTEGGLAVLKEAMQAQAAREAEWFAVLSPRKQATLMELLEQLADQRSPGPQQ